MNPTARPLALALALLLVRAAAAAPPAPPAAKNPPPDPAGQRFVLDPRIMEQIASSIGRSDKDAKEVAGVFRDPGDGLAAVPVSVRLKTMDAHPLTYVRGEPVRLEVEETGDVRERHWQIEPRVSHVCNPDPKKGERAVWWSSPADGVYTVQVTSVGRVSGIATDKLTITIVSAAEDVPGSTPASATVGAAKANYDGGEDPTKVVRQALAKVPAATRRTDQAHVREVIARSNNLSDARAYLVRPDNSLGPEKIQPWLPFLDELEKLFDALNDAERIPTAAHVRGAMEQVARAME